MGEAVLPSSEQMPQVFSWVPVVPGPVDKRRGQQLDPKYWLHFSQWGMVGLGGAHQRRVGSMWDSGMATEDGATSKPTA